MARHANLQVDTCLRVYFCDPTEHRGTNENTNGLLRQYFAKGTDISVHKPTTWRPWRSPSTPDAERLLAGRHLRRSYQNLRASHTGHVATTT